MFFYSCGHEVFSFELLLKSFDLLFHLGLLFLIETILTRLSSFNKALLVLNVQFCLNFCFINCFFLFRNFLVIFVSLFCCFVFGFAFIINDFFDFEVEFFLFGS